MVDVHIVTYCEEAMLPLTVLFYKKTLEYKLRYVHVWDNDSDDKTKEVASKLGCQVHTFSTKGELNDKAFVDVKNRCWKLSLDAEWALVVDADEWVCATPKLLDHYQKNEKAYLLRTEGYDVVTERDVELSSIKDPYHLLRLGVRNVCQDKPLLMQPKFLNKTNYGYGCHTASPTFFQEDNAGFASYKLKPVPTLYLFHVKYVNSDVLSKRYEVYKSRLCQENLKNRWGYQYLASKQELLQRFRELRQAARFLPSWTGT